MNSDFSRKITLLRKEKRISQKQAAADLGVSQALLSHYEKGIRECGLDFLVKAADYYNVSCDFLLGRSTEPSGKIVSYEENDGSLSESKIISGAVAYILSTAKKTESKTLFKSVYSFLLISVYKAFRTVFSSNPKNEQKMFSIPKVSADKLSDAAMNICSAKAETAAAGIVLSGEDTVKISDETVITTNDLSPAILTAVKLAEEDILNDINY